MRLVHLDYLRTLCLALIVLAHSDPPALLFQIRNFDVPMLLMVAGASFGVSYKQEPYLRYVWRRTKRLVLPCLFFFTAYFGAQFLGLLVVSEQDLLTGAMQEWRKVSLYEIGYTWIIRVFLLIALVAPFLKKADEKMERNCAFLAVWALALGFYAVLYEVCEPAFPSVGGKLLVYTVFNLVPYGLLFALGQRWHKLTAAQKGFVCVASFAVFAVMAVHYAASRGAFVPVQEFKYPPSLYYLSFALFMSGLVWQGGRYVFPLLKGRFDRLVSFVSSNSIWFYLWHIVGLHLCSAPFYLKAPFVFLFAGCLVFAQLFVLERFLLPRAKAGQMRKLLKATLSG